jgi:hypothetical protein
MQIDDGLYADTKQLAARWAALDEPPPAPLSAGPGYVTWESASPFNGPPYAITVVPLDGSPAVTFDVDSVPASITSLAKSAGTPSILPATVSYIPGSGGHGATVVSITVAASEIEAAVVLAITPSADGKVTEIDFYEPSTKVVTSLHVVSVPSGMAALNGKKYTFYYLPATAGGLDTILTATIVTS